MRKGVGDFRAELARRQLRWYQVAGLVHLTPGKLGRMLSEREPMPADIAARIKRALNAMGDAQTVETR